MEHKKEFQHYWNEEIVLTFSWQNTVLMLMTWNPNIFDQLYFGLFVLIDYWVRSIERGQLLLSVIVISLTFVVMLFLCFKIHFTLSHRFVLFGFFFFFVFCHSPVVVVFLFC